MQRLLCALLTCLTLGALAASPALASHSESVYFEAPRELLSARTRQPTMAKLQALGVTALRVQLHWSSVAPSPNSSRSPQFDATNPAAYNWGQYTPLLEEAARRNWQVLLTVTAPVPRWATAGGADSHGLTRPSGVAFQQFMTAVARQFGSEVTLYAIWNEPNHPQFLLPQFNSNGTPASPRIYRGLFQAGYAGLQAAGIASPKVLMGETAPGGQAKIKPHSEKLLQPVAPLAFLRETLCLNSHYVKAPTCGSLPAYGYAHHAYAPPAGPFYRPPPESVTIGVLSRLTHALDLAAGAHAVAPHLPVYLTEFGVQSKPNRQLGVSAARQAEFEAISERIAYENPRVAAFSQYLLRDDPVGGPTGSGITGGFIGFQTGLEYVSGAPKPLYYGFPVPLVVFKRGHGYSLWGRARGATAATKVTVLVQPPHSSRFRTLKQVTTNNAGYWTFNSSSAGRSWRVQWRSPAGKLFSGPSIHANVDG